MSSNSPEEIGLTIGVDGEEAETLRTRLVRLQRPEGVGIKPLPAGLRESVKLLGYIACDEAA